MCVSDTWYIFASSIFVGLLLTCDIDWLNDCDFTQQVSSEMNILVYLLTLHVLYQRLDSNQGAFYTAKVEGILWTQMYIENKKCRFKIGCFCYFAEP